MEPGFEDARLLLWLYELRRDPVLRRARQWFATSFRRQTIDEFPRLCPPGSDQEAYFRMVYSYWEMASSFVMLAII